jgi:hypothetical protein
MFFRWPSSEFLAKAFTGGQDWADHATPASSPPGGDLGEAVVTVDRSEATCDGFTLCTTTADERATLLDMKGRVVHRWRTPFHPARPNPARAGHWDQCYLYPNGDLLAVCCVAGDNPYGFSLSKFDKDSRLLWSFPASVHHAVDVGEDGRIYTLVVRPDARLPAPLDSVPSPYAGDDLVVLSPEGKVLDRVSLLEAVHDSPYFPAFLGGLAPDAKTTLPAPALLRLGVTRMPDGRRLERPFPSDDPPMGLNGPIEPGDVLHANSVRVLSRALAAHFPLFKPGQVLISLRTSGLVAVVDPPTRAVVWAGRGPWQLQHAAEFLDNGRLLLFDNLGSPDGSRVLEYDPVTQAVPWSYEGEKDAPLLTGARGGNQRLANGNTLVVDPLRCRATEVTPTKEVVWAWKYPVPFPPTDLTNLDSLLVLTGARRYLPDEVPFLKGGAHDTPR